MGIIIIAISIHKGAWLDGQPKLMHVQCLQKVFTPLDFFHILLCYSLNVKCIKWRCFFTGLHTTPHHVKVELCFWKCLQMN
jgi:hypothetical protein